MRRLLIARLQASVPSITPPPPPPPPPPTGAAYLTDEDGNRLTDDDGNYLTEG